MAGPSKRDNYKDMLGMMPDKDLAELAEVTASIVAKWRKELEIEAYDPEAAGAAPPKAKAPAKKPAPPKAKAPAKKPAPSTVRALQNQYIKGPDGRTMRVDFRGIFRGELAAWLWEHHHDLVEPFPPRD